MSVNPSEITLGMQVACVRREIQMRERVYPKLVGAGKMKRHIADIEMAAMRAVLATMVYRMKAEKAHPDRGGSVEDMAALNEAIAFVRKELTP